MKDGNLIVTFANQKLKFNVSKIERMLLVSNKVVFTENEAVLLCVTMQERARAFAATI